MIEQLHETRPIIRPWNVDVEIQRIDVFFPRTTGLAGLRLSGCLSICWHGHRLKPMSLGFHVLGSGDLFCHLSEVWLKGRTFPLF